MELITVDQLCAAFDRRRCDPQTRPSTSFVDHAIDLMWRNFLCPAFGIKFQREVPLFLEVLEFPYNAD